MRYFFGEFSQILNLATRWLCLSCYSSCFSLPPPCSSLFLISSLWELYFMIKKGHLRVFFPTPTLSLSLVQSASDSLTKQEGTIYSKLEKHLLSAWISQGILCKPFALRWWEEVLGEEGKHRWLPELLQKGKGVCSWKLGLEMPGGVGVYFAGRDRQFHMRVVEKN